MGWTLSAVCLLAFPLTLLAGAPVYSDLRPEAEQGDRPIAVVGDLQKTLKAEKAMGRETNDVERERLVAAMHDERPGAVILLGDMVSWGASPSKWEGFDRLMAPFVADNTPVLAALGNHDYLGGAAAGRRHAEARFPQLGQSRWYARQYKGLGLVVLDSNHGELGAAEWDDEKRWYAETLAGLERDPAIRGVLVFLHHSPYTNSKVTGDDERVQADFVAPFAAARKTLALIGAHAHAYERFVENGKTFLVSGGGGGPRVRLYTGSRRRHEDHYEAPSPRPFHYLLLHVADDALTITVKGFQKAARPEREVPRVLETLRFALTPRASSHEARADSGP